MDKIKINNIRVADHIGGLSGIKEKKNKKLVYPLLSLSSDTTTKILK